MGNDGCESAPQGVPTMCSPSYDEGCLPKVIVDVTVDEESVLPPFAQPGSVSPPCPLSSRQQPEAAADGFFRIRLLLSSRACSP
jgi:hypothetical protein